MRESRAAIEKAIVCAAFAGAEVIDQISARVTLAHFSEPDCRAIFAAQQRLAAAELPIDPVVILDDMVTRSSVSQSTSIETLIDLHQFSYESAHVEYYCERLRAFASADSAREIGVQLAGEVDASRSTIDQYITRLDDLANANELDEIQTAADAADSLEEQRKDPRKIKPTGIPCLDGTLRGGARDGQLIVIGGRPGAGKSVLLTQIAEHSATTGDGALIVTLEMTKEEIIDRLSCRISMDRLRSLPLYFIDSTSDLGSIMALLRVACRRYKIGVIAVDYLQLAEVSGGRSANREQEIATISRRLKLLAKNLKVPIFVGSQLNRGSEKKGKPTLSDLRESGAIEQDADVVILLSKSEDGPESLVDVAKQRGGRTGELVMRLNGPKFFFESHEEEYYTGDM